jgi:Bacterial PH domain
MEWQHAFTIALTLVVTGVLAHFAAARLPQRVGYHVVLRYTGWMRALGIFGIILFAGLIAMSATLVLVEGDERSWRLAAFGTPFFAAMLVATVAEMRVHLALDGAGIRGRTGFRAHREMAWKDITEVTWNNACYWWRLRDRHGNTLRISGWLPGQDMVVRMLQACVPYEVWADAVATRGGYGGTR